MRTTDVSFLHHVSAQHLYKATSRAHFTGLKKLCCILIAILALPCCLSLQAARVPKSHQATGVKVGEVTDTSAIVWMRLTEKPSRKADGIVYRGRATEAPPPGIRVDTLEGSCPGAPGKVRLWYGTLPDLSDSRATKWSAVVAETDFTHQFVLENLEPGTTYYYAAETRGAGGTAAHGALHGRFETTPPPDEYGDVTFTVITGQARRDLDHPDGYTIYEAMAKLGPKFIVPTGDTVYYDSDEPRANTVELARYHWHRIYSFPRHIAFHLQASGYWEKDDHDVFSNDCWPTKITEFMAPMTFEDGQRLFREQVPMGEKTYRTYRWGKGLQIWLVEGRDFRSSNKMPDGPEKTIWGEDQKRWLKETLIASDADWKILISPTPIVGPDRENKADNHANAAFAYEGNEFRQWVSDNKLDNFFVVCGDRHWQYHSVHPQTGVREFSCGAVSDEHASGTPGEDPAYHRFHRVKGGFLSISVRPVESGSRLTFRFHDVNGNVVYEYSPETSG